jgi:hypothetical protein
MRRINSRAEVVGWGGGGSSFETLVVTQEVQYTTPLSHRMPVIILADLHPQWHTMGTYGKHFLATVKH